MLWRIRGGIEMKFKKYFFDEWKDKTEIEKKAIKSLKMGLELLLETVPRNELVAVYVKGSFLTREMNEKSDVDFVTILRTGKYVKALKELHQQYANHFSPSLQLNPAYTLHELRASKRRKQNPPNTHPSRFVKHITDFKIVYGKELTPTNFRARPDEKDILGSAKFLIKEMIPELEKKQRGKPHRQEIAGFSSILKATLWLAESELRYARIPYEFSYSGINNAMKNPHHIVHQAYDLRLHPTKDKITRRRFIEELKQHLQKVLTKYGKHT